MSLSTSKSWKIPVLAQKFMGVWPYNDSFLDKVMRNIVHFSLWALVVSLGTRLVEEIGFNEDIVIENLVGIMYGLVGLIKFVMMNLKKEKLKQIYDMIYRDNVDTTNADELTIMRKRSQIDQLKVVAYTICCCSAGSVFFSIPILYPFLDYIIPLENATRPKELPIYVEYFIDQQKHYYLLLSLVSVTGIFTVVAHITYDITFAMCVQHVTSLLDIICNRLMQTHHTCPNAADAEEEIYQGIVRAIELHKRVIKNVDHLESTYSFCWLIILWLNTGAIGGGLMVVLSKLHCPMDLVRYSTVFSMIFVHKYFIFSPGQNIINGSLAVFHTCYAVGWYRFSRRCRVLIKIMMMRSIRPLHLTGGKMFVLCMETYAVMLKGAMSYFTMLSNSRQT